MKGRIARDERAITDDRGEGRLKKEIPTQYVIYSYVMV